MAAPGYFAPASFAGYQCLDGSLRQYNPIHVAAEEVGNIWGAKRKPEFVLSIGSGISYVPPETTGSGNVGNYAGSSGSDITGNALPSPESIVPQDPLIASTTKEVSQQSLSTDAMNEMDGQIAWADYYSSLTIPERVVSHRLNPIFIGGRVPAFDDVSKIDLLSKSTAFEYESSYSTPDSLYSPVIGVQDEDSVEVFAGILRAGLYFFQFKRLRKIGDNKFEIEGNIRCRLLPDENNSFKKLRKKTKCFRANGKVISLQGSSLSPETFAIPIKFEHSFPESPIRIDVDFNDAYYITISGFPMDFEVCVSK